MLIRAFIYGVVPTAASSVASAEEIRIVGTTGFLGEWEVRATLQRQPARAATAYEGPLTLRHTGICTPNGSLERAGTMRLELRALGRVRAHLATTDEDCTFSGPLSGEPGSYMRCKDGQSVPLAIRRDGRPN